MADDHDELVQDEDLEARFDALEIKSGDQASEALIEARALADAFERGGALWQRAKMIEARALYFTGEYDDALALCERVLDARVHDPRVAAEFHLVRGSVARKSGAHADAEADLRAGIALIERHAEVDFKDLDSRLHNLLGLLETDRGEPNAALEHFACAIEAIERAGDTDDDTRQAIAVIHNNIGMIYKSQNEYERSLEHYGLALEGIRGTARRIGEGTVLLNVGTAQRALGMLDEAMRTLDEAWRKFEEGGRDVELRLVSRVKAEAHIARGEGAEAAALLETILDTPETAATVVARCRAHTAMAEAMALSERGDEVVAHYERALALARDADHPELELRVAEGMSGWLESQGDFERALDWYKRAHALERQVAERRRTAQMARLEARHELTVRRHEAALQREQNARLEALVAERTRELEGARQMAESASRAKSTFLALTSHELRTPLNAIIGYSEMVTEELEQLPAGIEGRDVCLEDLDRVQRAARRLLSLIDKILQLANLESGHTAQEHTDVDLRGELDGLLDEFSPMASARGVMLRGDLDALPTAPVRTDRRMLRDMLSHLLENALKFTERGHVELRAQVDSDSTQRQWLTCDIEDTGIGIAHEVLEQLLEPFSQQDDSFTRIYQGLGLGLTLCQRYTALLDGQLSLVDSSQDGTTFQLRVPLAPPIKAPRPS